MESPEDFRCLGAGVALAYRYGATQGYGGAEFVVETGGAGVDRVAAAGEEALAATFSVGSGPGRSSHSGEAG